MIEEACGGATEWLPPPGPPQASDSDDENVPLGVDARAARVLASQVDSDDSDDVPLNVVARRGSRVE